MRRFLCSPLCWTLACMLVAAQSNSYATTPFIRTLERPSLEPFEEAIRLQISERVAALDELLGTPATPAEKLAAAWGSLGELYLLYEFYEAAGACLANATVLAP